MINDIYIKILFPLILLIFSHFSLFAQTSYFVEKIDEEIILDGKLDEDIWKNALSVPFIMYEPHYEGEITENTEVKIIHDGEYLYIGASLFDQSPDLIRSNSIIRDQSSGNDHLEFLIDTFDDNENAVTFKTIPSGIRIDGSISNDAAGQDWISTDFNTFWSVETSVDARGWFAEFKIPFSSLRFNTTNGDVVMGISIWRSIARKNEVHVFPATPPVTTRSYIQPSLAADLILQDVQESNPVYITPYLLGGLEQNYKLNSSSNIYRTDNYKGDAGLDIKYGFSDNTTLDLTFNTDFAQVEADNQEVNLSRFPLFFPEKRPFFLERAGVFEFSVGGRSELFYSRRIGLSDQGFEVPIIAGVRVVTRSNNLDLGFLNMQTARTDANATENFSVVRLKKRIFNQYSTGGLMMTNRIDENGNYNSAYGLDAVVRVKGNEYTTVKWAQTISNEQPWSVHNSRLSVNIERRSRQGFFYNSGLIWSGEDFNPGMGFIFRRNFTQISTDLYYGDFKEKESIKNWVRYAVNSGIFLNNTQGEIETFNAGLDYYVVNKRGNEYWLNPTIQYENLFSGFNVSEDLIIPTGKYTFVQFTAGYQVSRRKLLRGLFSISGGQYYDGTIVSFTTFPRWTVSSRFEIGGSYNYDFIRLPKRNQSAHIHVPRLRLNMAVNKFLSANGFIQYSSLRKKLGGNIRFRYNFEEGHDLWLVFNQNINTQIRNRMQEIPRVENRVILLKYTYTFY